MTKPFNINELEKQALLALLKSVQESEPGDGEYDFLASVHAGRVILNHFIKRLENLKIPAYPSIIPERKDKIS